jgi:hypothetical protein
VSQALAEKPSGCVIWIRVAADLDTGYHGDGRLPLARTLAIGPVIVTVPLADQRKMRSQRPLIK